MIKELRIGNLVQHNGNWSYRDHSAPKIIEWNQSDWYALGECRISIEDISPIPLTEEWLEKFGLIKKYLENPFEDGGFDLKEDGGRWYYWVDNGTFNLEIQDNGEIWFEIYSCYRHIKYVHELQNLYFSLTGAELIEKK